MVDLAGDAGVSPRPSSIVLVIIGVIICLLNMGAAWTIIWSSDKSVMQGLVSKEDSATKKALDLAGDSSGEKLIFLDRIVQNDLNHRNIANKQIAVIVAMAASFSLIAIGFALFVMGVEAAYTISGKSLTGSLVIGATSLGLVCFLLAAIVIGIAITRRTEVTFAPMELGETSNPEAKPVLLSSADLPPAPELPTRYSEKGATVK
jgi:hypothetical protein